MAKTAPDDGAITTDRATIAEPNGYRMENFRASVPLTVTGAKSIDTPAELKKLMAQQNVLLLDVFPAPPKPDNLQNGALWIEPVRETLPDTLWLANAGYGAITPALETHFRALVKQAKKEGTAMVIFCEPSCWHSWNAAKRAAEYDATDIYWYRAGVSGWRDAGHRLESIKPERP